MLAPLKRTGGTAAPKTAKTSRRGSPLAAMPSPPLSRPCVPAESHSRQSSPQFCWNRLLQGCCCCCWVKFQKVGTGCLRQILHKAAHTRTAHAHAEPSGWLSHATSCALEFEQGERRWAVFKKRTAPHRNTQQLEKTEVLVHLYGYCYSTHRCRQACTVHAAALLCRPPSSAAAADSTAVQQYCLTVCIVQCRIRFSRF